MSQQRTMVPIPRRPVAGSLPIQATPATIQELIAANAKTLAAILPKSLTPERFARIALTSIERNPRLAECTPQSLFSCILQAAIVGLEVDNALGHAYLVPFRDTRRNIVLCTLILGYKGLVTLMHRAGKVSTVEAHVVREGDVFEYEFGLTPKLKHCPLSEDGQITHSYAIVRFRDGGVQYDVMTRKGVEAIRNRSRASTSGPWVTDYEEMAKKCPLRRISKLVPMSAEEARTVAADELADAGLEQTFEGLAGPPETEQLPSAIEPEGEYAGATTPQPTSTPAPSSPPEGIRTSPERVMAPAPDLSLEAFKAALLALKGNDRDVAWDLFSESTGYPDLGAARAAGKRLDELLEQCKIAAARNPG